MVLQGEDCDACARIAALESALAKAEEALILIRKNAESHATGNWYYTTAGAALTAIREVKNV